MDIASIDERLVNRGDGVIVPRFDATCTCGWEYHLRGNFPADVERIALAHLRRTPHHARFLAITPLEVVDGNPD